MRLKSLLPRRMMTRLALVLVAALAIEFAGNSLLNQLQERQVASDQRIARFAEQLAAADQIAAHVEPGRRPRLMAGMAIQGVTLNWVPSTVITDSSKGHGQLARLKARIGEVVPALAGRDLRLSLLPSEDGQQRDLLGALRLVDGSFVTFRIRPFLAAAPSFTTIAVLHLVLVALVLGTALIMTWTLVRPLGDLAKVAEATGRGSQPEIPVRGPWEVQRVATAFRAMQARLLQMMDDHTQALVAVSHDLRTPIQRMRLRSGLLDDEETRHGMALDLSDMEKFITSVADFIQSGLEEEEKLVDLAALAMTIADNVSDAGFDVEYDGPDTLQIPLKPVAMKRVLANLVDNACRHAEQVRIVLRAGDFVTLSVEDDGPGIPADHRERAFQPLQRNLARGTHCAAGVGLGLAIVKNAVGALGGKITLEDSVMGGLAAKIVFPASTRAAADERP